MSADRALARRLEAGHAHSATTSTPSVAVEEVAGGWAIFHKVDSPVTQAIGVGLNGAVEPAELDSLEAFFHSRGSPAILDLCTLADASVIGMIQERGYGIREISNVLVRRLDPAEEFPATGDIGVEPVAADEMGSWARLVLTGFAGNGDIPEEYLGLLASPGPGLEAFFGVRGAMRVATGAMDVHAGLATLFGGATLAHARGRGLQLAMIRHRLKRAAQLGCDLASASVTPGSISHRNYERAGFRLVYVRVMVYLGHSQPNVPAVSSA